jgi:hypothetical protein
VDGHQVAWVSFHLQLPDHASSDAHLLRDWDLAEARGEQQARIGGQGLDPSRCHYRRAAQLLRRLELRDVIVDPNDWLNQRLPDQLVEIVRRGYGGWVGQSSTDAMWLGELEAIFDLPSRTLRAMTYALMQRRRLGLTGMVVSPWDRRFLLRDDRDKHLSDVKPSRAEPTPGTLELFSGPAPGAATGPSSATTRPANPGCTSSAPETGWRSSTQTARSPGRASGSATIHC